MPSRHLAVFLLLAAACGSVDMSDTPDAGPAGADADPTGDAGGDGTTPRVAMVTPPDGAAGVRGDAAIVIAFTEPMDAASVEAAWTSTDLPAAAVAFSWNAAGDTLTVMPSAPLVLATGTGEDPSTVPARAYAFGLAATATDPSGMALEAPLASGFTTAKRMTVEPARSSTLSRTMRSDGLVLGEGGVVRPVGDTTANLQYKTFVTYMLPSLPAGVEIERAVLAANQNSVDGVPYVFGDVITQHVNTPAIDAAAFAGAPLSTVGALSTSAVTGAKSIDVTAAFGDDLAQHLARGERSQYRFEFPTATDSDGISDAANFGRDAFVLSVTYLAE